MPEPKIRLARKSDKEVILSFCENTWENRKDHIHRFWDKWVANPKSSIFVVTIDDIPVAIKRVVRMSEKEAWLEALRVDPNYRSQGLSNLLESHINQYLGKNNITIARCAIYPDNEIMKGLMSRRGYTKVGSYVFYGASPIDSSSIKDLIKLTPDDFDFVCSLITKSNFLDERQNIYPSRVFKCQELTHSQLKESLELGNIFALKQDDKLVSIAITIPSENHEELPGSELYIGYISGNKESLTNLFSELRKLACNLKRSSLLAFLPLNKILESAVLKAGYRKWERSDSWVYEWNNNSEKQIV